MATKRSCSHAILINDDNDVIDDERKNFGKQSKFGWRTGKFFKISLFHACVSFAQEEFQLFQLKSSKLWVIADYGIDPQEGELKKKNSNFCQNLIEVQQREDNSRQMKFHSDGEPTTKSSDPPRLFFPSSLPLIFIFMQCQWFIEKSQQIL